MADSDSLIFTEGPTSSYEEESCDDGSELESNDHPIHSMTEAELNLATAKQLGRWHYNPGNTSAHHLARVDDELMLKHMMISSMPLLEKILKSVFAYANRPKLINEDDKPQLKKLAAIVDMTTETLIAYIALYRIVVYHNYSNDESGEDDDVIEISSENDNDINESNNEK